MRRPPLMCVCSSPSAADSHYSLLPQAEEVKGENSKQRAAVQSQVAAFADGGVAIRMGVANPTFGNLSSKSQMMSRHTKSDTQTFNCLVREMQPSKHIHKTSETADAMSFDALRHQLTLLTCAMFTFKKRLNRSSSL